MNGIENGRVIPSMINKIIKNEVVEIWGDGSQTRSFIFVDDASRIILDLLFSGFSGTINVATEKGITIAELARELFSISGQKYNVVFSLERPTGPIDRSFSIKKLQAEIKFNQINIHEGLRRTFQWYAEKSNL